MRFLLFCWFVAVCCPIEFFGFEPSIDASWALALNLAADQGLKFGKDLVWTAGPYGYLDLPMPVGNNLAEGLLAQSLLWLFAVIVAVDVFFLRQRPLGSLGWLAALTALSAPLFHFNYQGSDILLAFLALLLLASSLDAKRWMLRFAPAAIAAGLALTLKFTAVALIGGAVAAAIAFHARTDRPRGLQAAAVACLLIPLSGLAAYWLHNPSWSGFLLYVRGAAEIVAGYSEAMSLAGSPRQFLAAAAAFGALILLARTLERSGERAARLLWLCVLPLAVSFKHGFVRQDIHVMSFFCFATLVAAIILVFTNVQPAQARKVVIAMLPLTALALRFSAPQAAAWANLPEPTPAAVFLRTLSGAAALQHLPGAFDLDGLRQELIDRSRAEHRDRQLYLPPTFVERVGREPVAFFSSSAYSFAVLENLDLRVAVVPQKYSAYTPYLDERYADWIALNGPSFLLFWWDAIDGRHPLAETPRAWLEVWRRYDSAAMSGGWLLLQRRASPRFGDLEEVQASQGKAGDAVRALENDGRPMLASVKRSLHLSGRMQRALLRVPPVTVNYVLADGEVISTRGLVGLLGAPLAVDWLPMSLEDMERLLQPGASNRPQSAVASWSFGSDGDVAYAEDLEITWYRLSDFESSPPALASSHAVNKN